MAIDPRLIVVQNTDDYIYKSSMGYTYYCQICNKWMTSAGSVSKEDTIDTLTRYGRRHQHEHQQGPIAGQLSAVDRCGEPRCQLYGGHPGLHNNKGYKW